MQSVRIASQKGVSTASCGQKSFDLTKNYIEILDFRYSYNNYLSKYRNFPTAIKFYSFTHYVYGNGGTLTYKVR